MSSVGVYPAGPRFTSSLNAARRASEARALSAAIASFDFMLAMISNYRGPATSLRVAQAREVSRVPVEPGAWESRHSSLLGSDSVSRWRLIQRDTEDACRLNQNAGWQPDREP